MSEDFDPSPRASKRQRTTRYGSKRTILTDLEQQPDTRNGTYTADQDVSKVYDIDEEDNIIDDELTHTPTKQISARKESARRTLSGAKDRQASNRNTHPKQTPREFHSPNTFSTTPEMSNKRTKRSQIEPASDEMSTSVNERSISKTRVTPKATRKQKTRNEEEEADKKMEEATPQLRSSGRQRRPTQRLVETLAESATSSDSRPASDAQTDVPEPVFQSPALKGILTPSQKQNKKGIRKSVVFNEQNEEDIEKQLGFRDIDTPVTKKAPKRSTPYPKKSRSTEEVESTDPPTSLDAQPLQNNVFDAVLVDGPGLDVPTVSSDPHLSALEAFNHQEDPHVQYIKKNVLSLLTSASLPVQPPAHLSSQYSQLHSLLKSTITTSESNSLLLLGPRGAGKSLLLNLALRDLQENYPADFHTVRLNGFFQTDDRIALREIWRQLGHSRDLDESETEDIGASYADTMASLLSLLSHPDEMVVDPAADSDLLASNRTAKSIVFILDEFDAFTTHPRQTLLYNLYDIAQSRKAPIVVVGCSSRMDVIECLEKRVKSRFSHRWMLVSGCKMLAEWDAEVKNALCVAKDEQSRTKQTKEEGEWAELWNSFIEQNFLLSTGVQRLVKFHFYTTKSLPDLFMELFPLVASLQLPDPASTTSESHSSLYQASTLQPLESPSILSVVSTLPILHLSLLISMCRLDTIHTLATSNFNLVYTHYTELIQTSRLKQTAYGSVTHSGTLRQWSRETCKGAWEELGLWSLIVPVSGGRDDDGWGGEAEESRMWRCELTLEDMLWGMNEKFKGERGSAVGAGAGEVLSKWCREV